MKEQYLNADNIEKKTAQFLDMTLQHRKIRKFALPPGRSALLVLDMQNFFTRPDSHAFVPSSPFIIKAINDLIELFEKRNFPVVFSIHTNSPHNAGMMARWWRDMIDSNSHGAAINDNIHIPENSYKTEKHQYSAFFDTELYDILNKEKAESIIITGVMTHLCCDATAREGFMHGFAPVMVADACASYNEELHAASLIALSHGFAQITDSKTIIQQINAQKI